MSAEMAPEVVAKRLTGMEQLLRGVYQKATCFTQPQRKQILRLAEALASLAQVARGKAGDHGHQRF